jgi:hypothetical protein
LKFDWHNFEKGEKQLSKYLITLLKMVGQKQIYIHLSEKSLAKNKSFLAQILKHNK